MLHAGGISQGTVTLQGEEVVMLVAVVILHGTSEVQFNSSVIEQVEGVRIVTLVAQWLSSRGGGG
mgnify:CR=1 FL=1